MDKLHLGVAQWLSVVAVFVGIPAATYYPFMFARIKFWKSGIGKSMFVKGIALMLVFWTALSSIPAYILHWTWFDWWSAFVNWFLVLAVWAQIIVMRGVQKSGELRARMGTEESEDGDDMDTLEHEPETNKER